MIELAKEIKAAQAPEIEQMQGWLTSWGNPPMPAMDTMPMEGMVAPADIEKLKAASGPEATKLFLEQMIGHHEGAITMAKGVIDGGQFESAKTMACRKAMLRATPRNRKGLCAKIKVRQHHGSPIHAPDQGKSRKIPEARSHRQRAEGCCR